MWMLRGDVASVTQNGGIIHLVDKYKQLGGGDDINFLTREDRYKFLKAAYSSHNYSQYALILETGLRTGEMIGLTWYATKNPSGVSRLCKHQNHDGQVCSCDKRVRGTSYQIVSIQRYYGVKAEQCKTQNIKEKQRLPVWS